MNKKVAVSTTTFAKWDNRPCEILQKHGFDVKLNSSGKKLLPQELISLAEGSVGIIAGTEKIDKAVLEKLPGLKVISRCGTGTDNIDLDAARAKSIEVCNTPDAPCQAVAELTVAFALNLLRKVGEMDRGIRSNQWKKQMGSLLSGKLVGIVGMGRVGRKVAESFSALGCSIAYHDPYVKPGGVKGRKCELDELLGIADILCLHLSFAENDKPVLTAEALSLMKKEALLINCSRGEAVDETALYQALKKGAISGAALDVFQEEPYQGPLKELEQVILTPHAGSYARETRIRMEIEAAENLVKALSESH